MPQQNKFLLPRLGKPTSTISTSASKTRQQANRLVNHLNSGAVIALVGELGAGKTAFVQGLAQGLKIPDLKQVLSPTYTLVNEYTGGRLTLVHIDFYRLRDAEAAFDLGIEEQIGRPDSITAIEWADMFPQLIPNDAIWVEFSRKNSDTRYLSYRIGE
ncbi:MAG: tRNA (adenosine(37)-N6)-threonylcarbamoyltransferase complex ATPase subunit type 1 TsaE [Deltaproteobacteria bacterium]|nr:tRNA (adenosine(37)-N6)-threonylcarbamoyltransferase complex ATPase subunit type 1 TsaE [Deltaproteobacteria bacterium]